MEKRYSLENYCNWCARMGYLTHLPSYFNKFVDSVLYSTSQIAILTGVHKETILRMFRAGELINQSISNTFRAEGKEIKEALFNRPNVIKAIERLNPSYFINKS